MSKWFSLIILILLISLCHGAIVKSYEAEKYFVDLYLNNDGSMSVNEEVVFKFTGGPFHFVTRDVPDSKVDKLIFAGAAMDGQQITESTLPNYYTISEEDGLHLKWYYTPLIDETHSFAFQYLVYGVYAFENNRLRFQWKPLPSNYEYPISQAIVKVHLPKEILLSQISFSGNTNQSPTAFGDSLFVYEYTNLSPNTLERVDFSFPENLIHIKKQNLISHTHGMNSKKNMMNYSIFLLFISLFVFWVIIGLRKETLDKRIIGEEVIYEDLPSSLEPALLSRLINGSEIILTPVYATLVNLAQRGVVKIQSLPKQKWYETNGSMSFEYVENQVELTPTEQAIIEYVFGNPPRPGAIKILDMQKIIQSKSKYLKRTFEDALIKEGFLDPFQMAKRKKLVITGLLVIFGAFLLFIAFLTSLSNFGIIRIISLIGMFFIGNLFLMLAALTRVYTDAGMMEMASWKTYTKYLRKMMKEPLINGTADDFNRIFPFALVMTLGREWVTYFKKSGVDVGAVWLESDPNTTDSFAPFIILSSISSPSSDGSSGGGFSGGGDGGGGGGGGGSSAG